MALSTKAAAAIHPCVIATLCQIPNVAANWNLAYTDEGLERLRRALEAVTEDLDAIERRPHLSLRLATQHLAGQCSERAESFVDHFAFALKRGANF